MSPDQYVGQVIEEIRNRHVLWPQTEIATLYFGGGTPSLISPELIVAIYRELANVGFTFLPSCETTIEINPATLTEEKLDFYLENGINRFSVGAQTFNNSLLKLCGRKHSADDTRQTLRLLREKNKDCNFSFDLLFALPGQTLEQLSLDLDEVEELSPPHLSAYCLTVPESHPMSRGRPPEGEQVKMFAFIEERLAAIGLSKYEISNFAKPGMESRHNQVYWRDKSYWGLGLSSHSYLREGSAMGSRFWNPKSFHLYGEQIAKQAKSFSELLPPDQIEPLQVHEALTDFCHMFLRTMAGLPEDALRCKFGAEAADRFVIPRLNDLEQKGLVSKRGETWNLSKEGQLLSNLAFESLTFLSGELNLTRLTHVAMNS